MYLNKRIFSGIQPSGELHIGNYFGAIRNWVRLASSYECIYGIVDYHAITIDYEISTIKDRTINAAIDLLACGLSPEKCTLFLQSDVPQHTELTWILSSVTQLGELNRMTQFKEKSEKNKKNINAGLFTYPVLQAADILIYHAGFVPVGEDQIQHIELTRTIARAFNNRFGEYFKEPEAIVTKTARILGLDGKSKMSKSLNNTIALRDNEETIRRKILREAVTDENRKRKTDPGNPDICNLYTIHTTVTDEQTLKRIADGCRKAEIGCVDCKNILLKNLMEEISPIQERIKLFSADVKKVKDILESGKNILLPKADLTIKEVKKLLGIL